jgi:tRNA U34 2-thiouridine synthase MnmA/TrmU
MVRFERAQWAPAPGQSVVFYHGDLVVGGGVIARPEDP